MVKMVERKQSGNFHGDIETIKKDLNRNARNEK